MNFSSLQSSVQKFGMNQALKYLEKDPETNIPKLMNLVDKVMPEGWYGSQRKLIREQIDEKGMIDVGAGVERELGISKEKLNEALYMLEMEGYPVYGGRVDQITNPGKKTTLRVIVLLEQSIKKFMILRISIL